MGLIGAIRSHPLVFLFGLAAVSLLGLFCSFRRSRSRRTTTSLPTSKTLLGIPNFWNVVSNLPFIVVGAHGPAILSPRPVRGACFFSACS